MESFISVPIPTAEFLELAKFLRDQGSDRDPNEVVRTAIDYWMANASWKPDLIMPETPDMESRGYSWTNKETHLFLPHGTEIRMRYKDQYHYAKVAGDEIIYEGKPVSPAVLAKTIAGSSRNAWRDLWIKKPTMKEWMLAYDIRSLRVEINGKVVEL